MVGISPQLFPHCRKKVVFYKKMCYYPVVFYLDNATAWRGVLVRVILRLFLVSCVLLSAPVSGQAGEVLDRVTQEKELTVAVLPGRPALSFLDNQQQIQGFDADVAREIAERMGVDIRFIHPYWEDIIGGEWNGKWDLAVSSITPLVSRSEKLTFPAVYYYAPVAIAVHKDDQTSQSVYDMDGKTVGVCKDCTFEYYLRRKLQLDHHLVPYFAYKLTPGKIRTYATDKDALEDLKAGPGIRLDAVMAHQASLEKSVASGAPFRILNDPVYYEPLAIAIDKGDKEFAGKLHEIVEAMREDGTLRNLSYKWFDKDLTRHP